MKNFIKSTFGVIAGASILLGVVSGASIALADRVSTAAGSVTSVGVSSSGTITIGSSPVTTSGTITADLNLGSANTWTAIQRFSASASSTLFSANQAWIGGTGTTTITSAGAVGIASSTPWKMLDVNGGVAFKGLTAGNGAGSLCLTSSNEVVYQASGGCTGAGTVTSVGLSDSNSTLTIGSSPVTTSGTITATLNLGHSNTWTALQTFSAAASSTNFSANRVDVGGTATTTLTTDGKVGIGSTTPMYNLTLGAGKSSAAPEYDIATSSTTHIDPLNGPVQKARIGTAAITFDAQNYIPGASVALMVCNPNGTAGAITWSGIRAFGTAPSQTTTANQCDRYVVFSSTATSTSESSSNQIIYYAQAGAGAN